MYFFKIPGQLSICAWIWAENCPFLPLVLNLENIWPFIQAKLFTIFAVIIISYQSLSTQRQLILYLQFLELWLSQVFVFHVFIHVLCQNLDYPYNMAYGFHNLCTLSIQGKFHILVKSEFIHSKF